MRPRLGDNVLIDQLNGRQFLARIFPDMKVAIGRQQVACAELLDAPYGAVFELRNRRLVRIRGPGGVGEGAEGDADMDGDAARVVDSLREANPSYEAKTRFGKAKWERRQRAAHLDVFRLLPVTPHSLCRYYVRSRPTLLTNELAPEAVAACIAQGLPSPRVKRLLVYDDTSGLFTASVLWRMQGDPLRSEVVVVASSKADVQDRCKELNLVVRRRDFPGSAEGVVLPRVDPVPLFRLVAPARVDEYTRPLAYPRGESESGGGAASLPAFPAKRPPPPDAPAERLPETWDARTLERVMARSCGREDRQAPWLADALLVCARCRVLPVLRALVPLARSGARFAVCSRDPTALAEAGRELLQKAACVGLRMAECFDTEMQVIEGMTHPAMSMDAPMAYTLAGLLVARPERPPVEGAAAAPGAGE